MGVIEGYVPPRFGAEVPANVVFVDDETTACPTCGHAEYQAYSAYFFPGGDRTNPVPLPRERWTRLPPVPCPDCQGLTGAERSRKASRYRKPAAYAGVSPDVSGLMAELAQGRWVWLKGPYRSGKTARAHELCAAMERAGVRAVFATARDFCAEMADARDYGTSMSQGEVLGRYTGAPFLALDDFGHEQAGAAAASDLLALVDKRSSAGRPTAFTSNFTPDKACSRHAQADASTAGAIAARLRERCGEVTVR